MPCLGKKNVIGIYQWLISYMAKVDLQQQQRLFYSVFSSVNGIVEFPRLFIFLGLKSSDLFWKLGGNELAGSLSCHFQLVQAQLCGCIFALIAIVCFMLYQALQ